MKIAMLTADLPTRPRSGVAYQASRLADELGRRGHDVTVFSLNHRPDGVRYRVKSIKAPRWLVASRAGLLVARPCAFAFQSYSEFDVIHAHGDDFFLLGRPLAHVRTFYGSAREEARYALTLKRSVAQRMLHIGEHVSRRIATVTVGISENTCESIGALDVVIPCGVDRKRFQPGKKSSVPSILFVGTLGGRKRGCLVVKAFLREIRRQIPHCELWLVTDDPVQGEGVVWLGRVCDSEIARLFREAWVATLPSTYEGFGVPYIEAMASGTPLVATPNVGANEIVSEDSGGLLVDPADLGKTLIHLLQDEDRRRDLGCRGRSASERFDWARVAARYEDAYRLALARKNSSS